MKAIISTISFIALGAATLHAQTNFEATNSSDILDETNWSNLLPAPSNDGTIAIDGDLTGDVSGFGNVTVNSGATLTTTANVKIQDTTSIIVADGTLSNTGNYILESGSSLTMTSASSVINSANVVVKAGTMLTLTDGDITTATGKKLNTDGVAELEDGILNLDLFDGGNDGVVNLTDTQITMPTPLVSPSTGTAFRTNDPWTFNFISTGTGQIRIMGRDDVDAIVDIIENGTLFTIDGVLDNNLSSYSVTCDTLGTLLTLSTGGVYTPVKITATSFDSGTRTFSLTWDSDDTTTYTLSESPDLLLGNWSVVDPAVVGLAGSTTYNLIGLPIGQTERFYRVARNPNP